MNRDTDVDILEERERLLDEWLDVRRRLAELQARETELLIERIGVYEREVAEFGFHRDAIYRSMIAEHSAAGRISKGSMEFAFTDARSLRDDFPRVRAAFLAGRITAAHVREIVRAGEVVVEAIREGRADAGTLLLFETAGLVIAEQDTPARTRAHVRQVASALAGETEKDRHRRARRERSVRMRSIGDGLALLTVVLPEYLAVAILDRLTQLANGIIDTRDDREPALDPDLLYQGDDPVFPEDIDHEDPLCDPYEMYGEPRPEDAGTPAGSREADAEQPAEAAGEGAIFADDTFTTDPLAGLIDPLTDPSSPDIEHYPSDTRSLDEVRTDVLTDLLLAAEPSEVLGTGLDGITGHIQITLGAGTAAGADDRLAELDGHGPLDPEIARDLASRSGPWTRLFLDPTGMVVETDSYAPTASMRRHLRARDQHCRFPGCRMPANRCEADHNHDHAKGGKTSLCNLALFCKGHHTLKHPDIDEHFRWTAHLLPDSTVEWLSPLGRAYHDPPPRRVMFV